MVAEREDPLIGRRLGSYKVVRPLGKGGMGCVYLAADLSLERPVALKVMLGQFARDDSMLRRFNREAKAAARLNHPNIVQVYAVGFEDGVPFIAMEYVKGYTLARWLDQAGRLPWLQALRVVSQIAAALSCAHGRGVIHRDIKPGNVLIDEEGRVRVADFGLAKLQSADSQLTTDGLLLGTPHYMSPEQCGVGEIGPASDMFSLGVVLYEMLSGSRPFAAETPAALIRNITTQEPAPLAGLVPDLPPAVDALVMGLLDKSPDSRIGDSAQLLREIARASAAEAAGASPIDTRELDNTAYRATVRLGQAPRPRVPLSTRWPSWRLAVAVVALAAAAGVCGVALWRARVRPEDAAPAATVPEPPPVEATRRGPGPLGRPALPQAGQPAGVPAQGFRPAGPGLRIAQFPDRGVGMRPLGWIGTPAMVLMHAVENSDTRAFRQHAFTLVDPGEERVTLLARRALPSESEAGPMFRPAFLVPHVRPGTPLRDTVLVLRPNRAAPDTPVYQQVIAQSYRNLEPDPVSCFQADPLRGHPGDPRFFQGGCFGMAAHPSGEALCLVLSEDTASRGMFLAERPIAWPELGRAGLPLTSAVGPIRNPQYAPDGSVIAYERMRDRMAALWLVGSGTPDRQDGVRLVEGKRSLWPYAFAPAGRQLVVSVRSDTADDPDLVCLDMAGDRVVRRPLGKGQISPHPWAPDGSLVVYATHDRKGATRIWARGADGAGAPILLFQQEAQPDTRPSPVEAGPLVSPDGRWIITELGADPPAFLFICAAELPALEGRWPAG
ncbi:MAG: serine/threonine-protein kinase [Candidatus Hydrogenedentes bacterium]|nr:serine/threonine-protein kinase [Candidatus Hydrogenedentota bacterium]